jgi:hypothetical protein
MSDRHRFICNVPVLNVTGTCRTNEDFIRYCQACIARRNCVLYITCTPQNRPLMEVVVSLCPRMSHRERWTFLNRGYIGLANGKVLLGTDSNPRCCVLELSVE